MSRIVPRKGVCVMLFRQMEYFKAIVETGSFSEAAELMHISQSAVSQQIQSLERDLNVALIERHNRRFTVTPAGMYFYKKCLMIGSDIDQTIRETRKLSEGESATLKLGLYKGYHGKEFAEAVALISDKYPSLDISVFIGNHEEIFKALNNETVDLALSDQRRAFSSEYNNLVLARRKFYVEIASRNPLSRLDVLDTDDLKKLPCILIANENDQEYEQQYFDTVIGLHGDFIYARSLREAWFLVITGKGFLPVDYSFDEPWSITPSAARIQLTRSGKPISHTYCAFWKQDNSGYYIEEFADILRSIFNNPDLNV